MKLDTLNIGGSMARLVVCLATLMLAAPSHGSAQAMPRAGDRIRVSQVDGTVMVGTLAELSADTVQLSVGPDSVLAEVPVAQIESLETSRGRSGSSLLTLATTSVLGAAVGALAWEECDFLCFSPFESEQRRTAVVRGGSAARAQAPGGSLRVVRGGDVSIDVSVCVDSCVDSDARM